MTEPKITLYEHDNFSGRAIELNCAMASLIDRGFSDQYSSIEVHSGVWELYEHNDYGGKKWIFWEGKNYSDWTKWGGENDIISSLKPVNVKIASHSECRVYEDRYNRGKYIERRGPVQNFKGYRSISFVTVLRGTWVGYVDADFKGPQILLQEGNHDVCAEGLNDAISSMRPIQIVSWFFC